MSELGRTEPVSIHHLRWIARRRERELQGLLDATWDHKRRAQILADEGLPPWTRGVRVEKVEALCWMILATEFRGH